LRELDPVTNLHDAAFSAYYLYTQILSEKTEVAYFAVAVPYNLF